MQYKNSLILTLISLAMVGCNYNNSQKNVISRRYVHKYGYDVSSDEWQTAKYPGQVLTMLKDGKTIVESYEDSLLHGYRTESFPHSQTIEKQETYERGKIVKRVTYNIRGVPQNEEIFISPTHILVTTWYQTGSPRCKEEYKDDILINGQYYTISNEVDSKIDNGNGDRVSRNQSGDMLSKDIFVNNAITYTETYYQNNYPHTTTFYNNGLEDGEKKIFEMTGEPISVEHLHKGEKHGLCTYYQNGYKYQESIYKNGLKDGVERHFVDGEIIVEETQYKNGVKHGPSIVYCDRSAKTTWYFENERVNKNKYEQLMNRQEAILSIQHN